MRTLHIASRLFALSLTVLAAAPLALGQGSAAVSLAPAADYNQFVLEAVRQMPVGGDYATTSQAKAQLSQAVKTDARGLVLSPQTAQPSFCSGATYLAFLKTLDLVAKRGDLGLDSATLTALGVRGQRDGEGVWGRWNANGPGTARLFTELGLGRNFTDYAAARPGDFMKIFWNTEIGKAEHGHSVIYLGTETVNGEEAVRFWSSNKPGGYGVKSVPKRKIARALFSRLEKPANVALIRSLPNSDRFLADMLTQRATMADVQRNCGL